MLASGFSTDIIGVGFFEDPSEFESVTKIRNLQRVGFLAMYIPDKPVSSSQLNEGISTFQQLRQHYKDECKKWPVNINGTDFLRPSSSLDDHLKKLLDQTDITKRDTTRF